MGDLNLSAVNNISRAKEALRSQDYVLAKKCVIAAAESILLLAKNSVGAQKKKYLNQYGELKVMLDLINDKLSASATPAKKQEESNAKQPSNADNPSTPDNTPPQQPKKNAVVYNSLKPMWLNEYIGQPQAVTAVRDLINAANLKNSAMPHLILYGSHGLGKTTFANIIANELHVGFTELNVTNVNSAEMIETLKKLKPRDVLFIDEIHNIPVAVAESVLYSAMQDGRIVYSEGRGKFAHTQTLTLPPFTLIGATTEIGKLPKPFAQRAIQIRLEEYTDEVLGNIVANSFFRLGIKISDENSLLIAKRCRNNPRVANNMVKRISDKALVRYASMHNLQAGSLNTTEAIRKLGIEADRKVIEEFFEENGIDEYGLENGDRALLKLIIERYNGGPVGIDTLARAMNEANNVISQKYEAYLIKKGMLKIEREGRVVMPLAYKALGLPESGNIAAGNGDDKKETPSKYEERKVVACKVLDDDKRAKIENIITYPANAINTDKSLDELFPDIPNEHEGSTKHFCKLVIDFGDYDRKLLCDSFLESRFATSIAKAGFASDIKAQSLVLPYVSQEQTEHRYFPDLIIKDYRNRIAIVELKNFEMVSYHLNIDKYETLKSYCTQNGYGYAEVMTDAKNKFVSVEAIKNLPINTRLEQFIIERIELNGQNGGDGCFGEKDFEDYVKQYGATDRVELYTILLNNRSLKNVDRAGNNLQIVSGR